MEIHSMTLEQLQDWAIERLAQEQAAQESHAALVAENEELRRTNRALQDRNNQLFMRVEQGIRGNDTPPEEQQETNEEFATKNFKEILRR